MIETVIAVVAGLGLCALSFHVGHMHGHRCERKQALKALLAMHRAMAVAMGRGFVRREASPWN